MALAAAPDWLPGVTRRESSHDGGDLIDAPPRVTWHTFEAPYALTAKQGAASLARAGNEAHFVLHPRGGLVQLLPASRAARCLENPAGGVQTNRLGRVHLQVEVIGYAERPFTADLTAEGRRDLARLVDFARSHGIPDVWPAGAPPAYPHGRSSRGVRTWTMRGGHYGHSQVPEQPSGHGDPGALDVRKLFATPLPPPPLPLEDDMAQYVRTESGTEGYLSVTPGGVHALTGAEWAVLQDDQAVHVQIVSPADWQVLEVLADRPAVDVQELADAIIGRLPAGGLTAVAVADEIAARMRV